MTNNPRSKRHQPRLATLLNAGQVAIFVVASAALVAIVNHQMRREALIEAKEKARLLLDRNLAIHSYFAHELRPAVMPLASEEIEEGYFDPVWMSSTFAIREIDLRYRDFGDADYSYKEAAIDARTPANEADAFEHAFIDELNADPELVERSLVRTIDGAPYFVTLRRGEVMLAPCLRCHSTPEAAPAGLVERFGSDRSFGRHLGDVVSAISIRIPLAKAHRRADRMSLHLSLVLLGLLGAALVGQVVLSRRVLVSPLERLRAQAQRIADSPNALGEQIPEPHGHELVDVTRAFNTMSRSLAAQTQNLERLVAERTQDLNHTNAKLILESEGRRRANEELEATIDDLRRALGEVQALGKLLPICASCKKIRDDEGYWHQVEAYIGKHAGTRFTHGLCPDCVARFDSDGNA